MWAAAVHWDRAVAIAATLRCACGPATSSAAALTRALHAAYALWAAKDPRNPNWWWNEIGVPDKVQKASVLFKAQLTVRRGRRVGGMQCSGVL